MARFSRTTIPVDAQPGLAETDVSASINVTNGVGIIAERAMYRTSHGTPFNAGHDSAGVTAANTNWFFAEGATGDFFDMFLLLANPSNAPTSVDRALPAAWRRAAVRQDVSAAGAEPDDHQRRNRRRVRCRTPRLRWW